jgi:trehalose 6-phosphate phosphatase
MSQTVSQSSSGPNAGTEKKGGTGPTPSGPATGPHARPPFALDPEHMAILLDIDGTLLDIAPTPQEVHVSDALRQTLQRLADRLGGALALISGRPLADIDSIFSPLMLAAVGGHGAEIRPRPDASPYRLQATPLDPGLKQRFADIAKLNPGILIEDKDYAIAIHYRLAPQHAGDVIESVAAICEKFGCEGLSILPGKAVLEIKPRGFDKGSGLQELMASPPFRGRQPIFVGDDVTDEAAFAVLPQFSGIGISVGGLVPGVTFNFDGPKDVRRWLERLSYASVAEAR